MNNHPDDKIDTEKPAAETEEILDAEYLDEPEAEGQETETDTQFSEDSELSDEELSSEDLDQPDTEHAEQEQLETEETADKTEAETTEEPAAQPAAKPANLRWDTMFLLLLTCVTLIRLGYLYIAPFDLGPDESYYWDWSRNLALGYYSKPPMIAWINALSTSLLGVSAEAVRMPAVVFGAIGMTGLYLCGRRMFSGEVGFWGVAAWVATLGSTVLGALMTTDVLLICCWVLALYTLWRALEAKRGKALWWLLTMVLIGLGSLGKQMMMVFPLLMFCYLLFSADRKQLATRWPWLTWIGSLLFLLPPLWWNFQNNWITFTHTAEHVEAEQISLPERLITFGEFIGGQMGMLTPITWLLLFTLLLALLLRVFSWSRQTKYLFFFSAIGLFGFAAFSFKQGVNVNWPAAYYPAGLLLLAAWGKEQVSAGFFDRMRRWFVPGIKLGIALTLATYVLTFALQFSFLPLGKKDPLARIKGWKEMGQHVGETLQQQPRPEQTFIIGTLRKYTAEAAFYVPGNPRTHKWPYPPLVGSQYDLWPGPTDKFGWDALILHDVGYPLPKGLAESFENIVDLGEHSVPIGAAGERKYTMWRGENLLSWPEWE